MKDEQASAIAGRVKRGRTERVSMGAGKYRGEEVWERVGIGTGKYSGRKYRSR